MIYRHLPDCEQRPESSVTWRDLCYDYSATGDAARWMSLTKQHCNAASLASRIDCWYGYNIECSVSDDDVLFDDAVVGQHLEAIVIHASDLNHAALAHAEEVRLLINAPEKERERGDRKT